MQKLMLTLSLTLLVAFCSVAASNNVERKNFKKNISYTNPASINSDCTVTASWTAQGQDCFGNPVSVTGSCTSTASSCSQAYSQAGGCAYTVATLGVLQINDCP